MSGLVVNDVHSQLNATLVARLIEPTGLDALVDVVRSARAARAQISVCGGRHAMGGQQFGTTTWPFTRWMTNVVCSSLIPASFGRTLSPGAPYGIVQIAQLGASAKSKPVPTA